MITVENLTFSYPRNDVATLRDISFSIRKGEIFGFLGPSGSGKSTTQKILFKLLTGFSGTIVFDGKPLHEWTREFYAHIGVSFELPNHYLKLTALENLKFFGSFFPGRLKDAEALLAQVDLLRDSGKPVAEFSKGMKMRLNFIRALLHDPPVLFLDEPTSGLDPINARKIKDMILELRSQGKTIFLTTHNMFDADELCDRVALLHGGEIKALDKPMNLKMKYGRRKVRVKLKDDPRALSFSLDRLAADREFMQALNNDLIESMHSEEATLEEAFIKITGDQLL